MSIETMILIVDDSKTNRSMLKDIFKDSYLLAEAVDGEEAMKQLRQNQNIAMVLLDLNMPRMDGYEVLEEMQKDPVLSKIPVVVNTQFGDAQNEIKALKLGAVDFITKPYNPETVLHRVRNVIDHMRYERQCVEEEMTKRQMSELKFRAERDMLTGIYNRETFCRKTLEMLQGNRDKTYVLLQWDIQRFKVINDLFGVKTGDKILRIIALKFAGIFKGVGTFGRIKADNFACCYQKHMFEVEDLLQQIETAFKVLQLNYDIAVYIGVYPISNISVPVDQMCDRANMALLTVKGNYIKRYAVYDNKLRETMLQEQQIVSEMNEALAKKQFCIYLQPIYNLIDERPIAAEALVRWKHPERGIISPGVFIPLFEKNGFIIKMDEYVWEETCRFIREELDAGKPTVPISVNVSRINLYNPLLCENILALITKYKLQPSMLKLEITESAYTDNPLQLIETIKKLQAYGFNVLTDDFGSGYSSLNMLKDVPTDILKIDIKFIDDLEWSKRARSVLKSVVQMAKLLDMVVVAEGVETKAQLDFLKEIDCDRVQGFYFSKPLPEDKFDCLMGESRELQSIL